MGIEGILSNQDVESSRKTPTMGPLEHKQIPQKGRLNGKKINLNFLHYLQLGDDLQDAIFFFGMSNSLVNPLIYGAFHLCPGKGGKSSGGGGNNNAYSLNR